jgi:glucose/arabinose dehydrogenase
VLLAIVLAAPAKAATVPNGFAETLYASGLGAPTAMAFAPDGRLFVADQDGFLRVVKNGTTLSTPFVTLNVDPNGERGLLGVAVDPAFATNKWIYVYYTAKTPNTHNRVSRFTANGDVAAVGSELPILDLPALSSARNHNGGAIHFGPDGGLYVAVGDNAQGSNSQSFTTTLGKILRINKDGTIPTDNPFYNSTTGQNRAIWALGVRNPFTFAFQPGPGRMLINDVGQATWEEINDGITGSNYGWPEVEGPANDPRFRGPVFAYAHGNTATTGCAITGGTFYNPPNPTFPSAYVGDYFFSDYCNGWIRTLDTSAGYAVSGFATEVRDAVDLAVGADGALYYLARLGASGQVYRVQYTGSLAPTITTHPASQTVGVGSPVTFTVSASGSPPLSYQWQRNGVNIAGATSSSYTISSAQTSDNGARFRARVTNSAGSATSNEAVLTVTSNRAPTATITAPAAGTLYQGGQTITYSGRGTDPEDGTLAGARFTWRIDFHHATHIHPFMPATSGATSGAFAVPTTGHTESDVWFRIHLTVTDSGGLTSSTYRDVMPQLARIQLATSPTGLQLRLDDQPVTTPYSFTGVVGVERKLEAVSPQTVGGSTWYYQSWSNGGTRVQTISTPPADMTYTATFANAPPPPSFRAYVNFQPASAPPVTGYYVDSGDVYGDRGNGYTYGWNASTSSAVYDRNSSRSPDQRYDTLIQTQHFSNPNAVWEIAVANGNYAVRVVAGDPMSHNSVYEVAVEGVLTLDGTPTETSRWVEGTKTVAVSDGRLTISSAAGASNNKLCFVEITAVG